MTRPARVLKSDDLPLRMTALEVCEIGRFSLATLTRKRRQDPSWLPSSPVQGEGKQHDRWYAGWGSNPRPFD